MRYPLEYFDYITQKNHYGGENNISEYNKIYERVFNDRYVKDQML